MRNGVGYVQCLKSTARHKTRHREAGMLAAP